MTSFKIELAGLVIETEALYESTKDFCRDYLTDDDAADISVAVTDEDIEAERETVRQTCLEEGKEYTAYSDDYLEKLALYRKIVIILIDYGVILFHSSAIAVDGQAYLFAARSGTGKTTHTMLWKKLLEGKMTVVNGDKPLIGITENEVRVFGTPWRGKEGLGKNISAPVKAICLLNRGEENSIEKISPVEAFPYIFLQTYSNNKKDFVAKVMSLISCMSRNVEFYRLYCNMEDEAAEVSYNGMKT